MKDQSHKDEMSKALRGDFARLRGRGVSTTLAPDDEPAHDVVDATMTDPEEALPDEDDAAPAPGWLDRLFGR